MVLGMLGSAAALLGSRGGSSACSTGCGVTCFTSGGSVCSTPRLVTTASSRGQGFASSCSVGFVVSPLQLTLTSRRRRGLPLASSTTEQQASCRFTCGGGVASMTRMAFSCGRYPYRVKSVLTARSGAARGETSIMFNVPPLLISHRSPIGSSGSCWAPRTFHRVEMPWGASRASPFMSGSWSQESERDSRGFDGARISDKDCIPGSAVGVNVEHGDVVGDADAENWDYEELTDVTPLDDGALLLSEEEDETAWMEGEGVDPMAEKIFFGEKVPFSDLGLGSVLCGHLESLGLPYSTAIQASAIPTILSGQDLVIGAETGSGKTLAYLLPIVERLLRGLAKAEGLPDELLGNARGWSMFPDVIVLVPNKELCEQVLSVLRGILRALETSGNTEITASLTYGSSYEYPFSPRRPAPSILVCTPSFLFKYTNMKAIPLFCKATTLVIDEADMLMEGSYKKEIDAILASFRRADRVQAEGAGGMDSGERDGAGVRRVNKTQYVLAAATLPTYGLKSVDQYIKKVFPDVRKIQQDLMHRHHPAIQQEFIKVSEDASHKIQAVIDLLREGDQDMKRTMIFANSAATCQLACDVFVEEGFSAVPYHKQVLPAERIANLQALRSGKAKILVCTDLASRGIDVPSVTHIIQLEMARNVVHHLHRLGRAARAGRRGRATNFFDDSTKDLVDSIREAGAEGSRLDGSFSRQRGFRQKFKKYGASRRFPGNVSSGPGKDVSDGYGGRGNRGERGSGREFSDRGGRY